VVTGLTPLLEGKRLTVEWTEAPVPPLPGDRQRLGQVIRNLVANAIKFSAPGQTVRLEIGPAFMPAGEPAARLAVLDEGVGIPEAELESVFDQFVQSSRTRTGAGGSGLGLTLSRDIVQAHQGDIRARNRSGGGAAFEVLLPLGVSHG